MEITFKKTVKVLGAKKGDTKDISRNLAIGLIDRDQAVKASSKTKAKDDKEPKSLDDMTVAELQEVAKENDVAYGGKKKADLLKELKEAIETKEEKTEYQTK